MKKYKVTYLLGDLEFTSEFIQKNIDAVYNNFDKFYPNSQITKIEKIKDLSDEEFYGIVITANMASFTDVVKEMVRQDNKWGECRDQHPYVWLAVLGEEVGEVNRGALEEDWQNYKEEIIQVIAVCMQMLKNINHRPDFYKPKEQ